MKKFIAHHIWWLTLLIALIMLGAHSLSYTIIQVDNISIILLLVILVSPFVSTITKIKYGDFEAEIKPEEVRKIQEDVSKQASDADKTVKNPDLINDFSNVKDLVDVDPVLALAKLRIELEKVLNKLYRLAYSERPAIAVSVSEPRHSLPPSQLVYQLTNFEVIQPDMAKSIREVISICNRAVHGEDIRREDARSVVDSGVTLLLELSFLANQYYLEPSESTEINKATVDEYLNAKYRLTTIIPTVEEPQKQVRVVNQGGLTEFLEGYVEYAEFIVEIIKIDGAK